MTVILTYIICKKCKERRPYNRLQCICGETEILKKQEYSVVEELGI